MRELSKTICNQVKGYQMKRTCETYNVKNLIEDLFTQNEEEIEYCEITDYYYHSDDEIFFRAKLWGAECREVSMQIVVKEITR